MIAVLDSGGSNLASVLYAIERLGFEGKFTSDLEDLEQATHWILPGVGSAPRAMRKLAENGLDKAIRSTNKPVLGICLGMQILFEESAEGNVKTLGVIPGKVKMLPKISGGPRLPHLGWNQVQRVRQNPLFAEIPDQADFYFVHSFAAEIGEATIGVTEHAEKFSSAVAQGNFMGVQFHPERSGSVGQTLLKNFLNVESKVRLKGMQR